ncbi:hypothetical protein ACHWQZ_G015272 [Mnemiopsis leidyi]
MAKLYITSPINNDSLYRPVTLDTDTTSSPLADSLDNHHGNTQVIIAGKTDNEVIKTDKIDNDGIKTDKIDNEAIISDSTDKQVVVASEAENKADKANNDEAIVGDNTDNDELVIGERTDNDEVVIGDKTDKDVNIADKNNLTPDKVDECSFDRDNSIEYVKTVSVPHSLETKDSMQKTDDSVKDLSEVVEMEQEVSDRSVLTILPSELSVEKSDIPIIKLSEKSNEEAKSNFQNPLSVPSTAPQSDDITAAAEKLNEVLLSESGSVAPHSSTQQKVNISDIVVIPDESPTHVEPKSSSNTLPSLSQSAVSAQSQNTTLETQTSAFPSAIPQNPEHTVSNSHPVSVITSNIGNSTAMPHMTSLQQSFIQKLIPSLINLNKPDNVATSHAQPAAIPALIPAQSHSTVASTAGQSPGSVHGGITGSAAGQSSFGVRAAKSNGVITIDDDDDLVVTQVIKPGAPTAAAPNAAPVSRNDSLFQLVSKIKSMVDPTAASQPKLRQLQQTLASLIKNQGLSRNMLDNPQEQLQQTSTAPTTQTNFLQQQQQQARVSSQVQQQLQQQQQQVLQPSSFRVHQDVQPSVSTAQRQGLQPQQIPQRQLQALLQQAIANRTQAQQQAVQQHVLQPYKPHPTHQQQQQRASAHVASSSSTATGLGGNSSNVVQQLLQAVMSKQQQQQQQQQVLKQQLLSQKQRPSSSTGQFNHASTITSQNQNQHLMLIENALKGSNPNLAANFKTLQDQLKAKSSNPADIKNELTAIISNVLRLRNSQQQMENTSPKPLKSPSLRRQIQTAHRPKLNTSPYHNKPGPSHNIQQLRKPVRAPTIDFLQNLPVVHHSKEKVQFLSVVGLITRQEHQRLILSHANRKRRIEEARNILQLEKVSFERKRKRPRKDDLDNDGDTHDNYCSKCRMAGELLMCDKCPRVYHLFCLDPPLKQVPDGEWFCSKCQEEKDVEESMDVNVIDVMEDPAVDPESREQIEELHRKLMEAKRVRLDLENTTDIT